MRNAPTSLALAALMVGVCSMSAVAHRLIDDDGTHATPENAIVLEDFELSQVVYHEVTPTSIELWFSFAAQPGQTLYWEFGLPAMESLTDYRPVMAVLGPGLPAIELPIDTPEGLGGFIVGGEDAELDFFFEQFTGTNSWILSSDEQTIAQAGTYYVVAFHPEDALGKFWVAIGKREEFNLNDVITYADTVAFVRDYHEDSAAPLSALNIGLLALSYAAQVLFGPILWVLGLLGF